MKQIDVAAVFERAKKAHGLKTDQELAEQVLLVPRETLASWKRRGSIPAKHLPALASGNVSLDWLLTGKGDQFTVDEFGHAKEKSENLDDEALWISLIQFVRESHEIENKKIQETTRKIDKDMLALIHESIMRNYPIIHLSKKKWRESGIVEEKDIYKALAVEYDLGTFDFHSLPYWEDDGAQ
jgi:hypothetical protein